MTDLQETGEVTTGELLDGRYRLQERIGEGGMARVYRAEDTILGRTVAVKILRGAVDDPQEIERARSETTLLASLNHHALVTLFDANVSEDGGSYLVMEYVEGITLRQRMSAGPIAPVEAASLAVDIAEALHMAHMAGIVHRDVKPSNILLWKSPLPGREWRAKIADFGIAYLLDSVRVTTPGLMVGTVAYIAPEQARGDAPAPPADIYALGIVLIEALTGTRPFADAEGFGTVMARLEKSPEVPESLEEGWRQLLRGMTAQVPEDRPTALEVAVAASRLTPVTGAAYVDEPTEAAAVPIAVPVEGTDETGITAVLPMTAAESSATRPVTRQRWLIGGLIAGAVLVATLIAGGLVWWASPLGVAEPIPTQGTDLQVTDPDEQEPVMVETPAPSEEPADEGGADPGVQTDNSGTGGNSNSGPGNNSGGGNGSGNSGKGKDK